MDKIKQSQVIEALKAKQVHLPCPRCSQPKFSIVGESIISIQNDPNVLSIGGPSIPTVIVACDNCGYITQHATIPLGLVKPK